MSDKVKSLGKLYGPKTDKNGREYFSGTLMIKNVRAAIEQGDMYKDTYGNEKVRLYVIPNQFKQGDETKADYSVLIGTEAPKKDEDATTGLGTPAADTTGIPF